ncbi:type IV pilus twitching motility protein PilT [Spiribacter vilamensis]|uniref:Twitching motility protein PilT n=1 Tax=Spiribacter vilamensis TaxID=531306 RepID=A0A4Q8CZY3_9GAMM|nr:type IV pilus twitching motility protein PilT [Spiribacter vilamensis]RZU98598.1 twitching motility protein PilT [Spiribacter vilamensis]TVO60145.1 type IV pilus twitching motility protein PilT [Spiribacter vilamensis]
MDLNALIVDAVRQGASDLHVAAGGPPTIRVDGDLRALTDEAITHKALEKALFGIMDEAQQNQYLQHQEVDFALQVEGAGRFRVNVYEQLNGPGVVMRAIPQEIPSLEELNAPEIIRKISDRSRGLVLVTGPTGSGKSTTLAAMVDHRNRQYPEHILTIEDPVEFVHQSNQSLITQREVGHHTVDVRHALRAALREDPDVILVGELRDPDTIRLALTAAETGHLVFGTLHTRTAASSIDRIINTFPGDEQAQVRAMLAESLLAVISQTLLKREGGGRVAGFEIMMAIPAIRNLIRDSNLAQIPNALQTGQASGMQTMSQSVNQLLRQGEISPEAAEAATGET